MSEQTTARYEITPKEKKFISLHLFFAIFALTLGSMFGPLQAFEHAGWDFYPYLKPLFKSYYQGLTLHGVLNALVWTTFFITGFLTLTVTHGLKRPLRYPKLNLVGFWTMVVGLVTAAVPLLLDEASVLYTFYPPLTGELGILSRFNPCCGWQLDRRLGDDGYFPRLEKRKSWGSQPIYRSHLRHHHGDVAVSHPGYCS